MNAKTVSRSTFLLLLTVLFLTPNESRGQSQLSQSLQQKLQILKSESKKSKATTAKPARKPIVEVTPDPRGSSKNARPSIRKTTDDVSSRKPKTAGTSTSYTKSADSPQEFAQALGIAVATRNLTTFNELVSWQTIAKRATRSLSGKWVDEFREEFNKQLVGKMSLGAQIISAVQSGGSYEFLRLRKTDKTVVAIFRMILPGGRGVNYHEYSLAKTNDGKVKSSDIYIFLAGEFLSDSIRRTLITSIAKKEDVTLRLSGKDELLFENVSTIEKLTEALSKNEANEARSLIMKLPEELRADRAIQSLTLRTYKGSPAFMTVADRIRKSNPDDVFMDMLAIDILANQKKYEDAIDAIQRIRDRVGGDPHLDVLSGRMHLRKGEAQIGRKLITEAIAKDDGLLGGYWNLISFSLEEKNHKETLRLLQLIDKKFKVKFRDLREIPSYGNFVKTKEFESWDRYQKSQAAPTRDNAPTSEPNRSKVGASTSTARKPANRTARREKYDPNSQSSRK